MVVKKQSLNNNNPSPPIHHPRASSFEIVPAMNDITYYLRVYYVYVPDHNNTAHVRWVYYSTIIIYVRCNNKLCYNRITLAAAKARACRIAGSSVFIIL